MWDMDSDASFTFGGDQWISWDDYVSTGNKGQLAYKYNLGGVVSYSIDMDDHEDRCGAGGTLQQTLLNGYRYDFKI